MNSNVPFVHLHLHTTCSFLDGAMKPSQIAKKAQNLGMPAVAITDHGNMFGVLNFYEEMKKNGIKPIIGSEVYVAHGSMKEKKPGVDHLVLLAENEEGYKNLMFLVSAGYLEGFYRYPRVDMQLLASRARGLIALSGCIGGRVPRAFLEMGFDSAVSAACELKEIFGPQNFFLEIQNTGRKEQTLFNSAVRDIAREVGVEIVATNDVHYLEEEDYLAHQVLVCIGTGKKLSQEDRLYNEKLDIFMRSGFQMREALPAFPDSIENTLAIAGRCKVEIEFGKIRLPVYDVGEGVKLSDYLAKLAREGLEERFKEFAGKGIKVDEKKYMERLEEELSVIDKMGFAGYFLIVCDFIRFAHQRGIPVGPGRGSGGGSLVAFSLRITDIDPIRYNLLFERFLNPERISMPDFDIDFCKDRRDEVIHYVMERYGTQNVSMIATFHQLKSKLVVRDVGRVLGMNYSDVDKIAKMIPAPFQGRSWTIDEAMEQEPKLKKLYNEDEKVKLLLDLSRKLEGLTRHAGTHAAGIVIGDRPLFEYTPLYQRSGDSQEKFEVSTQYDKDAIEKIGLVKFDFLGLKTLTVIETTIKLINETSLREGKGLVLKSAGDIPLDDPETFDLISSGDTTGVFQLESRGFREMLRRLKPRKIEDIIAAVALYRPGPLQSGTAESYISRKNGMEPVTYTHPALKEVLEETYGVIIYQEQVMQAARILAGFSMAEADNLRRAMGKKKAGEMALLREKFINGAVARGINKETAEKIYDQMQEFASYAFNKSHSAGYAIIAFRTAYLKTHYPVEFLAALMTCDEDRIEKIVTFINEGRALGIKILPPDINESDTHFKVIFAPDSRFGKAIRFGLKGVKGVGSATIDAIMKARKDGPFIDLFDFCARVDLRACNRSNIDQLIKSGAFDTIGGKIGVDRAQLFAALDSAMEHGRVKMKEREEGQQDLLSLAEASTGFNKSRSFISMEYPIVSPRSFMDKLKDEKDSLGCYVTGHPLERFKHDISRFATALCAEIAEKPVDTNVTLVGIIEDLKEKTPKSGSGKIAFFNLEDLSGRVEVFVPPKVYDSCGGFLDARVSSPVVITGIVEHNEIVESEGIEEKQKRIIMQSMDLLENVRRAKTKQVHLHIQTQQITEEKIIALKNLLSRYNGRCTTFLHLIMPQKSEVIIKLPSDFGIDPSGELIEELKNLIPDCFVEMR